MTNEINIDRISALLFCGCVEGHMEAGGLIPIRDAIRGSRIGLFETQDVWAFINGYLDGIGPGAATYAGPRCPPRGVLGSQDSGRDASFDGLSRTAYRQGKARGSSALSSRNVVKLHPDR